MYIYFTKMNYILIKYLIFYFKIKNLLGSSIFCLSDFSVLYAYQLKIKIKFLTIITY